MAASKLAPNYDVNKFYPAGSYITYSGSQTFLAVNDSAIGRNPTNFPSGWIQVFNVTTDFITGVNNPQVVTLAVAAGILSATLNNTTVTPNSYTNANITIDAQGRISAASNGTAGGVTSVSGTANRITVSPTTGAAVVDIAANYAGQTSLVTLGTITTGVWNGTKLSEGFGGTNQTTYTTGDTLYASAANTLSKLTAGTNGQVLTLAAGIPSWATPTTGTVTTVSVVSANGFAGSVATATTTPAITLSTTITGILKGNGTAISAATAGTDYQAPITLTTTGSSGVATFIANTLNIPNYSIAGLSPLTTKGDLFTFSTVNTRLAIGADATLLMADAAQTTGNKWIALSGDLTIGLTGATTLATVNSNVGTFGSATQASVVTVNAKGLVTAASNVTITPAASSITGGQTLSRTNDTNVTLTLGGSPTTALLAATSLTLGWTGTLGTARGGTNLDTSASSGVAQVLAGTWTVSNALPAATTGFLYTLTFSCAATNLLASTTYFFGVPQLLASTGANARIIEVPVSGNIIGASINASAVTAFATGTATSTLSVRLNNTTDLTLDSALRLDAKYNSAASGLSTAVVGGTTTLEMKLAVGAITVASTGSFFNITLIIKTT